MSTTVRYLRTATRITIAATRARSTVQALRWLDEAIRIGFPCYPWFARDPLLQPIRGDTRFVTLIMRLREQHEGWIRRYGE